MIRRILGSVIKFYRMHKAVRVVNREVRRIYNDPITYGLYEEEKIKLPEYEHCMESYKPWFIRNPRKRERVVLRAFRSAVKQGFLTVYDGPVSSITWLEVSPDKGEDFIEMWFWGFIREGVKKNGVLITILGTIVGLAISSVSLYFSLQR